MINTSRCSRASKTIAFTGIGALGLVHALWAGGSPWPARSERELALAVVGSDSMPARPASAVVAVAALSASALVAGAGGTTTLPRRARVLVGIGLLGRGVAGGAVAARLLKLPEPGEVFRRMDSRHYRPLCITLGVATLIAARSRTESTQDAARSDLRADS